MLFKEVHLQANKLGKITLTFRKWQKPGSLLHTAIGVVKIHKIEAINENDISTKDLLEAGFTDKNQLLKSFTNKSKGTIF